MARTNVIGGNGSCGRAAQAGRLLYRPWGETRVAEGTPRTTWRFTGQREDATIGLYFYNARWYDPKLGRFLSADTIVPSASNPQALNRYTYVLGNPLKFVDPTGHRYECGATGESCGGGSSRPRAQTPTTSNSTSTPAATYTPVPTRPTDGGYQGGGGGSSSFGETETAQLTYSPRVSAIEAWSLVFSWFLEIGPQTWYFGPESSLTQDIMYDPGMQRFREEWTQTGFRLPFEYSPTADAREGGLLPIRIVGGVQVYAREHLLQLPLSTLGSGSHTASGPIDAVGGIIGSLDRVSVRDAGNGMVRFDVFNRTGWASGTRVPGTNVSIIQNHNRSDAGPGGTIVQYFYWWEPMPSTTGLIVTQ